MGETHVDSLERQLKLRLQKDIRDTTTLNILLELNKEYADINILKAYDYVNLTMEIAEHLGKRTAAGAAFNYLGQIYREQGLHALALQAYTRGYEIYKELNDTPAIVYALNDIGNIYFDRGEYELALKHYREALEMSKAVNFKHAWTLSLNNIGLTHMQRKEYKEAHKYFMQALNIRRTMNSDWLIAHSYSYLGINYQQMGEYDTALSYFRKAQDIFAAQKDESGLAATYGKIAAVYLEMKDKAKALHWFNEAASKYAESGNSRNLAHTYIQIGNIYAMDGQHREAVAYFKRAVPLAIDADQNLEEQEAYLRLSESYSKTGDYKQALYYYKRFDAVADSIYDRESTRKLINMQAQYELQEKDRELKASQNENSLKETALEADRRKIEFLFGLVMAVFIIAMLITVSYRNKLAANRSLKAKKEVIKSQKEEIEKSNEELKNAKDLAEASSLAKTEFLSRMSHEIRTPINGIIGFTDLLMQDDLPQESRSKLESIRYSANNLSVIINDILDLSKIEAGKVEFERLEFNVRQMAQELVNIASVSAQHKDIVINCNVDQKIPDRLTGDPTRLYQILLNLLNNAVKFTAKGSIKLDIDLLTRKDNRVRLQMKVSDTGIGIPADKLDSIFDNFHQAGADIHRVYGGTGLGLTIAQKLVELQGGSIKVESKPGQGSVFSFALDFDISEHQYGPNELPKQEELKDLQGMRILCVEDNLLNQMLLKQLFEKWNAEVTIAGNGEEGVTILEKASFDLVFMDLQMPVMDGHTATRIIRDSQSGVLNHEVPIVGLTADAFPETQAKVLEEGMNGLVLKPFKQEELYEAAFRFSQMYAARKQQL